MVNFTGPLMHNGVNKNARRYDINTREVYESILPEIMNNILESDSQFSTFMTNRYSTLLRDKFDDGLSKKITPVPYNDILDFLKNDYLVAIISVSDYLYDILVEIKNKVESYKESAVYRLSKIKEREEDILNTKENIILSDKIHLYAALTDNPYDNSYINPLIDQVRLYLAELITDNKYKLDPSEDYAIFIDKMQNCPINHEEYVKDLYDTFRNRECISIASPDMIKDIYNKSGWSISCLDLLILDISQFLKTINYVKDKMTTLIEDYQVYSRLTVNETKFEAFKANMYLSIAFLHERLKIVTEFYTARSDACIEYIDNFQSILIDAINQTDLDNCIIYDAPSNINDEYYDTMEYYTVESELLNTLYAVDVIIFRESMGLIFIEESLKDSITKYMNNIVTQVTNVTTKINNVTSTKVKEKLADHLGKIESPEKPDPNFNILNYTRYNLDKMDRITPTAFNYLAQKEDLKSKDSYMKKYYPDLYDTEKSVYQKMLELVTIGTDDKVVCTPELIDNCKDYCTRGYKEYLANNQAFAKAIEDAKASAESLGTASGMAATQSDESQAVNDAAIMTEADAPNPTKPATQRVTTQPGVTKVNRDNNSKDKNTGFEDHDNVDKREGDTELMKALTMYCGITTKILSARIKVVNLVFKDRLKILLHYVTKNGWNKKKKETE